MNCDSASNVVGLLFLGAAIFWVLMIIVKTWFKRMEERDKFRSEVDKLLHQWKYFYTKQDGQPGYFTALENKVRDQEDDIRKANERISYWLKKLDKVETDIRDLKRKY